MPLELPHPMRQGTGVPTWLPRCRQRRPTCASTRHAAPLCSPSPGPSPCQVLFRPWFPHGRSRGSGKNGPRGIAAALSAGVSCHTGRGSVRTDCAAGRKDGRRRPRTLPAKRNRVRGGHQPLTDPALSTGATARKGGGRREWAPESNANRSSSTTSSCYVSHSILH